MRKIKLINLSLVCVALVIIWFILTLPKAPGDFYRPYHIANFFFPDLGIDFKYSPFPELGKSMMGYYLINKIVLLILNNEVMLYYKFFVAIISDIILRFFGYILIFSLLFKIKELRIIYALVCTMIVNFPGIHILFLALFIYILAITTKNPSLPRYIVFFLVTFSISLYWHTLSAVSVIILVSYLSSLIIFGTLKRCEVMLVITGIILETSVWVYLRAKNMLRVALQNAIHMRELLSLKALKLGIFSKSSLVPVEYRFRWQFILPVHLVDNLRLCSYLIAYIVLLMFICYNLHMVNNKSCIMNRNNNLKLIRQVADKKIAPILTLTFLLADFQEKIFKYLAIHVVGMTVWFTLLYPLFIVLLIESFQGKSFRILSKSAIVKTASTSLIIFIIILSTGLTALYNLYTASTQLPSTNTDFKIYNPSFLWISWHIDNNSHIMSDADTIGYYLIYYSTYKLYENKGLYFSDIHLKDYERLYKKQNLCTLTDSRLFVILNLDLYYHHLVFYSTRYWDVFEPLPPSTLLGVPSTMVVYNDETFIIGIMI